MRHLFLFAALLALLVPASATAQYFGRNKVQYDAFQFRVFETEHFEIYYYPESEQAVRDAARMAERWYNRHVQVFGETFAEKKPLIFYANDADFHQTNTTFGRVGEGTGGFTEALKERVVMPLTGIYASTDHVLGHELVHSFQYDLMLNRPDSQRVELGALPLWMVEGMAEYLSVGREDPHTALWLRDAALRDDLPTTEQLTKEPHNYFPYRYGQAYMAYIGGKYGDATVADLFRRGGRAGLDSAFVYTLGISADSLSAEWIDAVKRTYLPLTEDREAASDRGSLVLAREIDAGNTNIAPVISPDGRYVAFLSERDLLNFNLFVADAEDGEVIQRLKATGTGSHFDNLRFLESSGTWSPDGTKLAVVTFAEGDNELIVVDALSGTVDRRIAIADVGALANPAWSPDGRRLVFTGIQGGVSDLYLLDLDTQDVRRLTQDRYADLQPAWSPDGRTIAFVTDRGENGTDFEALRYAQMRLGLLNLESGDLEVLQPTGDATHTNPQFSPDGRSLYFTSDWDGFKDIYRYERPTDTLYRVTHLKTGVTGITALAPALSVALQSGRLMYSVYEDGNYHVYGLDAADAQGTPITTAAVAGAGMDAGAGAPLAGSDAADTLATAGVSRTVAALLPPTKAADQGLIGQQLGDPAFGLPEGLDTDSRAYKPRLKLDFVAPPSVGASVGGPFGGGLYGGVGFFFSDMLGNHSLNVGAQVNGSIRDFGGQVSYLNRANRLNWGASVGHIPLRFGGAYYGQDGAGNLTFNQVTNRLYIDQASVFASYPLSTTRRIELGVGGTRYGFESEVRATTLSPGGLPVDQRRDFETQGDPVYFAQTSLAFVGDNASFGLTSPVQGQRFRFDVTPYLGTSESYVQLRADYRKYWRARPFTFAVRGLHIGNYGASETDDPSTAFDERLLATEYLGYSQRPAFVRGYSLRSFDSAAECTPSATGTCAEADRLFGSRAALVSAELRVPLLGVKPLSLVQFPYLPTEVALFADAGLAWTRSDNPLDLLSFSSDSARRTPVVSAGVSTRFNLFGYTVLELFYAYPFQRPERGAHFGIQLSPGW